MSLVAILAALLLVLINVWFVFAESHHGALYILAAVCAVILLLVLIIPVAQSRSI